MSPLFAPVWVLGFRESDLSVGLRVGDRLLTVLNSMVLDRPARAGEVARDLVQGDLANPRQRRQWQAD
jgi:hypothetical protein